MPHKLYAIQYNGQECLIHLSYDEQRLKVDLLSEEMIQDLKTSSFEVNRNGELLTPAVAKSDAFSLEALKDLYHELLSNSYNRTVRNFDERLSAA